MTGCSGAGKGGVVAMHGICSLAACVALSAAAAGQPIATRAVRKPTPMRTDNWEPFLFFLAYGEIDPFDSPWQPVRHPVFQRAMKRMGVNVSCPIVISTDVTWGLYHRWTVEWLKHPGSVMTPWY